MWNKVLQKKLLLDIVFRSVVDPDPYKISRIDNTGLAYIYIFKLYCSCFFVRMVNLNIFKELYYVKWVVLQY